MKWMFDKIWGGVISLVISYLVGALFLAVGIVPIKWLSSLIKNPPSWFKNKIFNIILIVIGLSVIILLIIYQIVKRKKSKVNVNQNQNFNTTASTRLDGFSEKIKIEQRTIYPDPEKRKAIDEIYSALEEAEKVFDHGCTLANTWKEIIIKHSPTFFVNMLIQYRTNVSNAIVVIGDLCGKKHTRFKDIHSYRMESFGFQQEVFEAINNFIGKLNNLPEKNEPKILELIVDDAKRFQTSVGSWGKWIRESLINFRDMRNNC